MSAFTRTFELDETIRELIENKPYHEKLNAAGLKVDVLMYEESGKQLRLRGADVFAFVKINSKRERALGLSDGTLIVDKGRWGELNDRERIALIDHELYHFTVAEDEDAHPKYDDLDRPILRMRPHDIEVGWFKQIAQEHKGFSIEVKQARDMIARHGNVLLNTQMSFDFDSTQPSQPGVQAVDPEAAYAEMGLRPPGLQIVDEEHAGETPLEREERLDREEAERLNEQNVAAMPDPPRRKRAAAGTGSKRAKK